MRPWLTAAANTIGRTEVVEVRAALVVVIRDANIHAVIVRTHATDTDPGLGHRPPIAPANRANRVAALATRIRKIKITVEVTAIAVASGATIDLVLVRTIVAAPTIVIVNFCFLYIIIISIILCFPL